MDPKIFILCVVAVQIVVYFFHTIFKTCSLYPYLTLLNLTGVDIGLFRLTWTTSFFNRSLQRWGLTGLTFLRAWFSVGAFVTICLLPISLYLLLHSIFHLLSSEEHNEAALVTMVPGVNLPLNDILFYLSTLAIGSIFHELGHVLAARVENIAVCGVGLSLFVLLPSAFVSLPSGQLSALPPRRQLRIVAAGVWHNVVLAMFAYIVLILLPVILGPIYATGRGVAVLDIKQDSPLLGPSGLEVGDTVVTVNDCEVADVGDWQRCSRAAIHQHPLGYCVNEDLVHQMDESIPVKEMPGGTIDCCSKSASANLCFETLWDDGPLQILQYSCLPGRTVIGSSTYSCRKPNDCPPGLHCIRPLIANGTTLLRIQRTGNKAVVIFIGNVRKALLSVVASDFVPKTSYFSSSLPEILLKLCKYLVLFSAGFAIVNVIPCFYSDGHSILQTLLRYLGSNRPRKHRLILVLFNTFGISLLILNFLIVIWQKSDLFSAINF